MSPSEKRWFSLFSSCLRFEDFEELIRAKAKLAQAGLALTPRKPAAHPKQARVLQSLTRIRESEQRVAELIDPVTELFLKQSKTQDLLTKLLSDFASLQVQTQAPQGSSDAISVASRRLCGPATLPRGFWLLSCLKAFVK